MLENLIQWLEKLKKSPQCRVRIVKTRDEARMPTQGTPKAAGYDLTSAEDIIIPARGRALIHTGLLVAPPNKHHIEVRPRSGLALRHGIMVLNSPGTIDADYRGEIMVIMFNTTDTDYKVSCGDRIAQAIIVKHCEATWEWAENLDETGRGTSGFGSTGF